jgi:predicted PurR-regulated permease PerM
VIALCIGGYAFSYLKSVLSPLLIALLIFFLTNPIVRFFQARNLSPTFSYVIVLLMTIVAFLGLGRVFFGSVQEFSGSVNKYGANLGRVLDDISSPIVGTLDFFKIGPEKIDKSKTEEELKKGAPIKEPSKKEEPQNSTAEAKESEAVEPASSTQGTKQDNSDTEAKVEPPKVLTEKERLENMLRAFLVEGAKELVNGVIGTSLGFLEISLMTIFYLFFILIEAHKLPNRIKRGFAYESTQNLMEMGVRIQRSIEEYLRVKTAVSFGLGVTTGLIGMLFGLDFWLLWGGFMFISNYVTYIGSMVALIPPIAIAFLQIDPESNDYGTTGAVVMTILMIANRFFWIDYVEIKFSGQQLNVSPVILLFSIGLFGALWGVIGMVLAVPLVTSVKIALAQFDSTSHLASLLSED